MRQPAALMRPASVDPRGDFEWIGESEENSARAARRTAVPQEPSSALSSSAGWRRAALTRCGDGSRLVVSRSSAWHVGHVLEGAVRRSAALTVSRSRTCSAPTRSDSSRTADPCVPGLARAFAAGWLRVGGRTSTWSNGSKYRGELELLRDVADLCARCRWPPRSRLSFGFDGVRCRRRGSILGMPSSAHLSRMFPEAV